MDWSFLNLILIYLIFWVFQHIGTHLTIRNYIFGTSTFGMSIGALILLSHLLNGQMMIISLWLMKQYGIWASFLYAILSALGIGWIGRLARKIRTDMDHSETLIDLLTKRLSSKGTLFILGFLLIGSIQFFLLQGIWIGSIMEKLFSVPYGLTVAIFFLAASVLAGLGGFDAIRKMSILQMTFVLFVAMFLPISIFLRKGIDTTFQELQHIPHLLAPLKWEDSTVFSIILIITFFSWITDISLWQRFFSIKPAKISSSFNLAAFSWFSLSMAFVTLNLFTATEGFAINIFSLPAYLVAKKHHLILLLFMLSVFSVLMMTWMTRLQAFTSLFLVIRGRYSKHSRDIIQEGYFFSLGIGFFMFLFSLLFKQEEIDTIHFMIVWNMVIGISLFVVLFTLYFLKIIKIVKNEQSLAKKSQKE
ncbi:hypothetical protein TEPIDINF_002181 [Tepidibacillus infernus]|uniref:Uncharacterized protein n=1 Tax=Tepidibacillus decaturensis TaxID=1413211 RepID=A0A135L6K2_9BACI|nr:hypothetical protein [Tepidibacillus decaturensis]KXG44602.1 hypothetical protein U473_11660 [Tepidibacillus decaturensis]